jgi:outer membrane protein OmpA-like peptidoglycan-associated protein
VVPTKIKVIDNANNTKVDYVYNPDPVTGNYLVILPPGKNYDLVIESEGYLPYTLNINIPNQTRFYELYQKVVLKLIKQFDVVVGQEVEVSNAFYDLQMDQVITPRKANEAMLIRSDSLDMYDLMDAIISSSDKEAFEYLLELMYNTNPIDNVSFDANDDDLEKAKRIYFYDESDTTTLQSRVVDGETIFSLPTFYVTEEAKKQKEERMKPKTERKITYNKDVLGRVVRVYFDVGKSSLDKKYEAELSEVLELLRKHPDLGIEIAGFASPEGNEELNRQLSNARAIEVLNYFNYKGIVRRRILAKGYGATTKETNPQEARRVEIRVVDINDTL